ncbi:hypothetical protein ANTPLA_LOCUS674 [Anthophora plagiata]
MTTATLKVYATKNKTLTCRTLVDTCSTANFITEDLANKLRAPRQRCSIPVGALNSLSTICKTTTTLTISSLHSGLEKTLNFLIIPQISSLIPNETIDRKLLNIPRNLKLADPNFHQPAPIHMLIGAGTTLSLFSIGQINLSPTQTNDLILQKTQLGWVIGGTVDTTDKKIQSSTQHCHHSDIQGDLDKFWKVEEIIHRSHLTPEETACEEHFQKHTRRTEDGRYVVALPFKNNKELLGESYHQAFK